MVLLVLEATSRRQDAEHNARAWLAWNTAALGRVRKLPKLSTLTIKPRRRRRPQTWQEQLAIAKLITAAHSKRRKA